MGTRLTGYPSLRGVIDGADVADPLTTIEHNATDTTVTLTEDATTLSLSVAGSVLTVTPTSPDGGLVRLPEGIVRRANTLLRDTGLILQPDWRTSTHTLRVGTGARQRLTSGVAITATLNPARRAAGAAPTVTPSGDGVTPTEGAPAEGTLSGLTDAGAFSGEVIVPEDVQRKWDVARAMHRAGLPSNLMLQGPPGTGKTHLALALSHAEGRRVIEHGCMGMSEAGDWFGPVGFRDGQTTFTPTPFYWALVLPGPRTLVLDEVNRASTVAMNALLGLLGGSPTITLPHNGQQIVVAPDLQVVMTANVGSQYGGASAIDPALLDRLSLTANVPYLPEADERRLLIDRMAHHGLTLEDWQAAVLVTFGNEARQVARNGDVTPVSPRQLLAAAGAIAAGGQTPLQAVEDTILSDYSREGGEASEYTAIATVVAGIDWREPTAAAADDAAAAAEAVERARQTVSAGRGYAGPHAFIHPSTGATVACTVSVAHSHDPADGRVLPATFSQTVQP